MLSDEERAQFEARIAAELTETRRALADGESARATVALDQTSVGRLSRMDAMQQQAMAHGVRERLMRQKWRLEAAQDRIHSGQFGICCDCGDPIPIERLEADIATPFCAYCQEEIDARREGVPQHDVPHSNR
jgi:DnaK suppressor protein